jgi:hypothetical protein
MHGLNRSTLDKTLALGGVILILLQVLLIAEARMQIIVVALGILINQVGVWGLAHRLMPDRRGNVGLRSETDGFIELVRRLSSQYSEGDRSAYEATKDQMHEAVDRIASVLESAAVHREAGIEPAAAVGAESGDR